MQDGSNHMREMIGQMDQITSGRNRLLTLNLFRTTAILQLIQQLNHANK
jgi:hypothetical protein